MSREQRLRIFQKHQKHRPVVRTQLTPGAVVTTNKNTVDNVVTEYGVAELRGRSIRERARALIEVAHPSFRDELRRRGGASAFRCYQCATCSSVCQLAPTEAPFPRRQMLYAQWGLADKLAADHAKAGLEILALNIDMPNDVREKAMPLLQKAGLSTLKVHAYQDDVMGLGNTLDFLWGGETPAAFLYDGKGTQVYKGHGKDAFGQAAAKVPPLLAAK